MIIEIGRSTLKDITINCYRTLTILKKNKRYTLIIKKQLAESLILIKLDHCNPLFSHVPKHVPDANRSEY